MYIKTITYTDYSGIERTEKFAFNLTATELLKLQMKTEGGYSAILKKIMDAKSIVDLSNHFDQIIDMSFGVIDPNSKRFHKSPELLQAFRESPAYDAFYIELLTNTATVTAFTNNILPPKAEMERIAEKMSGNNSVLTPVSGGPVDPATV